MGKITATLTDLATLEGAIDTATCSPGTKATVGTNGIQSDPRGKRFDMVSLHRLVQWRLLRSGKAAEAGGVFDFTSEDNEAGAFRGAFGADKN